MTLLAFTPLGLVPCCYAGPLRVISILSPFFIFTRAWSSPPRLSFGPPPLPPAHVRRHIYSASPTRTVRASPLFSQSAPKLIAHQSLSSLSYLICFLPLVLRYDISLLFSSPCLYYPHFSSLIVIVCNWKETWLTSPQLLVCNVRLKNRRPKQRFGHLQGNFK